MSERLGGTARREDIEKDLREFVAEETSKQAARGPARSATAGGGKR
jgi:hypothetical protein